MDWVTWVIPVIAVVVWILTSLVNSQQQRGRTTRQAKPTPSGEESAAPKPRRSASDVEKFLEEVRRRRDIDEARKRRTQEEVVAKRREEQPRPEPARPPLRSRLESEKRKRAVPPPLPEEVLIAKPVPPPLRESTPAPAPPSPSRLPALPRSGVPVLSAAAAASPVHAIMTLLRNPDTIAAAVMLHEILQPPLSRRTRRR